MSADKHFHATLLPRNGGSFDYIVTAVDLPAGYDAKQLTSDIVAVTKENAPRQIVAGDEISCSGPTHAHIVFKCAQKISCRYLVNQLEHKCQEWAAATTYSC
eukprot:g20014.t1